MRFTTADNSHYLWRYLDNKNPNDPRDVIPRSLAQTSEEVGLPVFIRRYPQAEREGLAEIWTAPIVGEAFDNLFKTDPEIGALEQAINGSSTGKPRTESLGWNDDLKNKVIAQWWSARGNPNRAQKMLQGQQPLSPEDVKIILIPKLRKIRENL